MFKWLKKILGMQKNLPSSKPDDGGRKNPISTPVRDKKVL